MEQPEKCPIWATFATRESFESAGGSTMHWVSGFNVTSARTDGRYAVTKDAYDQVGSSGFDDYAKARLTTWIIDQRRLGVVLPKVTAEIVDQEKLRFYPRFETKNANGIDEDLFKVLAHTESIRQEEVVYLLDVLKVSNFLNQRSQVDRLNHTITPEGYAHLSELETRALNSAQGFVAMWFDPSMTERIITTRLMTRLSQKFAAPAFLSLISPKEPLGHAEVSTLKPALRRA